MNRRNFIGTMGIVATTGCVTMSTENTTTEGGNTHTTTTETTTQTTTTTSKSALEITSDELVRQKEGEKNEQAGVKGVAVATDDLSYAEIDATFIDNENAHVGSWVTVTENLDKDQKWKFEIYAQKYGDEASAIQDYELDVVTESK